MEIEERIAAALDGTGVEEPAELTVPEKETDPRYTRPAKHQLFRMKIELSVETIEFGKREEHGEHKGDVPSDVEELLPVFSQGPVENEPGSDGDKDKRTLGHAGTTRQQ